MSWNRGQGPELVWSLGDLSTETGAALTNFTCNGQRWFDFSTTPTTVGQMTGAGGTFPLASVLTIDTKGCDLLAISFAGKITAVGTQTAATGSALRPVAFGTPFPVKTGSPTAWQLPYSLRTSQANTTATGQFNNDAALYCFGDSSLFSGATDGWGNSLIQNVLQQADGTNPVAGDYLRWHFFIGRRQQYINTPTIATPGVLVEPSLFGISSVSLTMLVINAATAGTDTQSMAAQMFVHRLYRGDSVRG